MRLKKEKGITRLSLMITIMVIIILIIVIIKVINNNLSDSKNAILVSDELEMNLEKDLEKDYIDSTDYEIAKILFSQYFEDEFNESLISEASYDSQYQEFSCSYVLKTFDNFYEKDMVTIKTRDFITYDYSSVEYEYDEEMNMNIPYSWSSTYNGISNEAKNKIIDLAQTKKYYTATNLSNDDYENILKIILKNDVKDLQKIIEKNNYILHNYYISNGRIYYIFTQKNNEENYIQISSWIEGVMGWNVYGASDQSIYNDSYYSEMTEAYIMDFSIHITEDLDKLENIYNTIF